MCSDQRNSLSKGSGSTAWTFGLFSDLPQRRQQQSVQPSTSSSFGVERWSKGKAASVAPSPEILHRSLTPPLPQTLPSWALGRNERRTRSLERCSQQRVNRTTSTAVKPPVPTRVRSRSLEKNYTLSTTSKNPSISGNSASGGADFKASTTCPSGHTPRIPRKTQVAPEVLATWCTFSEAFGGGRPKVQPRTSISCSQDPALAADERDSPGSPVFEELFLPPPKFASESHTVHSTSAASKRNSVAGSSSCCSGGHSAGVSCSSKSTPRSSPVPETVLYGSREAPVLERHCVEGGEFIIAWLSHSKTPKTSRSALAPLAPLAPHVASIANPATIPTPSGSTSTEMHHSAAAANGNGGGSSGGSAGSNRSFINKPARGWLHSDLVIVREGITYFVRVSTGYLFLFTDVARQRILIS